MKISRIYRAFAHQETALSRPGTCSPDQTEADLSVLLRFQTRLKELPEISEWRITFIQQALQHEEISPDSAEIAAAMMEWFCSNKNR